VDDVVTKGKEYAKRATDVIASAAEWASEAFTKVWEKVKEVFKRIYEMAKEAANKGLNAFAKFFGVEMSSAEATSNPDIGDSLL